MLFGHIGITAGVGKACDILMSATKPGNSYNPDSSIGRERLRLHYLLNGIKGRIGLVDYRMVLLGSLLPDIIDKPVWFFIGDDISLGGRDYAHTLLFNLTLFTGGLILTRYRKPWLLIISLSSFMHLILDQMWNSPEVLLWPLLEPLPKRETVGWFSNMIHGLFSYPEVYVPEIVGLVIVFIFAYRLVINRSVISFIKGGAIE